MELILPVRKGIWKHFRPAAQRLIPLWCWTMTLTQPCKYISISFTLYKGSFSPGLWSPSLLHFHIIWSVWWQSAEGEDFGRIGVCSLGLDYQDFLACRFFSHVSFGISFVCELHSEAPRICLYFLSLLLFLYHQEVLLSALSIFPLLSNFVIQALGPAVTSTLWSSTLGVPSKYSSWSQHPRLKFSSWALGFRTGTWLPPSKCGFRRFHVFKKDSSSRWMQSCSRTHSMVSG